MNNVPLNGDELVEGTGLRWWRMAHGLDAQKSLDVTIGVWKDFPLIKNEYEDIKLINWGFGDDSDKKLLDYFDTVILPMSMSGQSSRLISYVGNQQQLIVDAYAPFYVEASTRSGSRTFDMKNDSWYEGMVWAGNEALSKADYILYASDNQKFFYEGLLSGIGGFSPESAGVERFVEMPGVVEYSKNQFISKNIKNRDKLTILWFGALYPWYDIKSLLECFNDRSISKRAQLLIVGGSNPMYKKTNLRFNGQYNEATEYSKKLGIYGKSVFFSDWVSYSERMEVFNKSDVAISLNADTLENKYSWRIRVSDLAGNGVPVITNGGDPLGEMLINKGCAFRTGIDRDSITRTINSLLDNKELLEDAKARLEQYKDDLHINKYAKELSRIIIESNKPRLERKVQSFVLHKIHKQAQQIIKLSDFEQDNKILLAENAILKRQIQNLPKTVREHIKYSIKFRIQKNAEK